MDGELVSEDLLPIAIDFCSSTKFLDAIESFKRRHSSKFEQGVEGKSGEVVEIPHEWHSLFMEYQEVVDDLLEQLAAQQGFTTKALYRCCQDAVDGKFTALFTEHEHKWFVEEVMGWTDFDEFIAMMRRASNRQRK